MPKKKQSSRPITSWQNAVTSTVIFFIVLSAIVFWIDTKIFNINCMPGSEGFCLNLPPFTTMDSGIYLLVVWLIVCLLLWIIEVLAKASIKINKKVNPARTKGIVSAFIGIIMLMTASLIPYISLAVSNAMRPPSAVSGYNGDAWAGFGYAISSAYTAITLLCIWIGAGFILCVVGILLHINEITSQKRKH
jgi:hypothetical protein